MLEYLRGDKTINPKRKRTTRKDDMLQKIIDQIEKKENKNGKNKINQ